jgi:hypothetical protein
MQSKQCVLVVGNSCIRCGDRALETMPARLFSHPEAVDGFEISAEDVYGPCPEPGRHCCDRSSCGTKENTR